MTAMTEPMESAAAAYAAYNDFQNAFASPEMLAFQSAPYYPNPDLSTLSYPTENTALPVQPTIHFYQPTAPQQWPESNHQVPYTTSVNPFDYSDFATTTLKSTDSSVNLSSSIWPTERIFKSNVPNMTLDSNTPSNSDIESHEESKGRQRVYGCPTCGKQYCRKSTLKSHIKQHLGNKPFMCHVCGKTFTQAANLTAHKRVHTGEKPFACSVCLRPFSQSSSLVTHRRTHTGERPYPCRHCSKSFTDSSTLTKHMRTHTGQKPYGCHLCLMRFSQSGNLHRHMKTHRPLEN
ncbi:unnamed protein product [Bursaphelenchus xylophilus]|uniref:(pine wood nematode) hypothetical protein n=1 Tax=Bursaphelenchus xylophilus TaxID=6326 RepID=A0A1I7S1S5_BURXY|nr:unnamed protein product [Bursaphelenchus xylophilus]CAG9089881.1 unnamed protein product [Bursaphelenchus xylophilus]